MMAFVPTDRVEKLRLKVAMGWRPREDLMNPSRKQRRSAGTVSTGISFGDNYGGGGGGIGSGGVSENLVDAYTYDTYMRMARTNSFVFECTLKYICTYLLRRS